MPATPASRRRLAPLRDLGRLLAGADFPTAAPAPGTVLARLRPLLTPLGVPAIAVLTVVGVAELQSSRGMLGAAEATLLSLAGTAPLLFVLWRPLIAWRFAYTGAFVSTLWLDRSTDTWPWSTVHMLVTVLVLGVAAARTSAGITAWIAVLAALPCYLYTPGGDGLQLWPALAGVLIVGDQVRRRTRAERILEVQEEITDLARAQHAVLEERARIAREMHDVVAHHMSMIAVRAETAPYRIADVSTPSKEEFAAIADAARDTLTDMRRLLGVLRTNRDGPHLAPQPTLAGLPALIGTAADAGLPVTMELSEVDPPPPEPVALAAYRIVQEAVANAGRHAPGAPVRVRVRAADGNLLVTVINDPSPGLPPAPGPAGHGLLGMRERAQALGGTFTAAPTDGGFTVSAVLPYGSPAPRPEV
ncbi:signal transduction histidine kinase [Catenuloplanes nepalensis]|uniref:histidine kinase n=1 Tax=Catenuloplanes nepalensis TaxID=587533 RepID=A0ABT9MZD1_9ACTN|nr:histidine kinase [Catenuloplanes nepalensis]MDP9796802.1 signal transduction histidine kinase [Catenuloplanes nepalensis]